MLTNTDRFRSRACKNLPPLGEPFKLPNDPTRRACVLLNPFRYSWQIVGYPAGQCSYNSPGLAHCVIVRRLAGGLTRTIAQHYIAWALDL